MSSIFGHFWDRIFSDGHIVSWVKYAHYTLKDRLIGLLHEAESGVSVRSMDSVVLYLKAIDVPTNECIINRGTIGTFNMGGLVHQSSHISSISIPKKYINNGYIIQNSVNNPENIWVVGTNAMVVGEYVALYTLPDNGLEVTADTIDGKLVPVYRIYVWARCDKTIYTENLGTLCGFNLGRYTRTVRQALWEAYTKGVSDKVVNTVLSNAVGNEVCLNDSTVVDIWREDKLHYILCSDDKIYAGEGLPARSIGDRVCKGDVLFTGLNRFDSTTIPSPADVPCITINSNGYLLYAVNDSISTIPGHIGTIPNMGNDSWVTAVVQAQKDGIVPKLSDSSTVNPASYALTQLLPGALTIYTVNNVKYEQHELSDLLKLFDLTYPTAVSGVFGCVTPETVKITADPDTASVHYVVSPRADKITPTFQCSSFTFI